MVHLHKCWKRTSRVASSLGDGTVASPTGDVGNGRIIVLQQVPTLICQERLTKMTLADSYKD